MAQPPVPLTLLEVMQRMTAEPRCWGGVVGGGCLPPPPANYQAGN